MVRAKTRAALFVVIARRLGRVASDRLVRFFAWIWARWICFGVRTECNDEQAHDRNRREDFLHHDWFRIAVRLGTVKKISAALVVFLLACGASGPPDPLPTPGASQVETCGSVVDPPCECSESVCDVLCDNQTSCTANCTGGAQCGVVDCFGDTSCTLSCSGGSLCDYVDCRNVTSCNVDCSGGGKCNVNCEHATSCDTTCSGGSPCLLYCGSATSCTFGECSGGSGMQTCPNDIVVCNRPCPTCGDEICDRIASETCTTCPGDCGKCD